MERKSSLIGSQAAPPPEQRTSSCVSVSGNDNDEGFAYCSFYGNVHGGASCQLAEQVPEEWTVADDNGTDGVVLMKWEKLLAMRQRSMWMADVLAAVRHKCVHYYSPNFICRCAKENANRSCGKWIEGAVSACEQVCGGADDADDDVDDRCSWHIHCRRTFSSPFLCVVHQALSHSLHFFSTYSIYFGNVRA